MRFWPFLFVLCVSCGGGEDGYDPSTDNHGYGYEHDAEGLRGLKVRYRPALEPSARGLTNPENLEFVFDDVSRCTGLRAPMLPFVIIVPFMSIGQDDWLRMLNGSLHAVDVSYDNLPTSWNGIYFHAPALILIDTSASAYRHEIIHYLLASSNGDSDPGHTSPLFLRCS